jgi:hypothetical protein
MKVGCHFYDIAFVAPASLGKIFHMRVTFSLSLFFLFGRLNEPIEPREAMASIGRDLS